MGIKVRQATSYDISAMVILLEGMREESPLDYPPIHHGKLVSVLNAVTC